MKQKNLPPFLRIVSILGVLFASHGLPAGDGHYPVWEPTTITQPGHYIVTRSFSGATGIDINSDDVTLDLNGMTITVTGSPNGVVAILDGRTNVTIRNGSLNGGKNGIQYSSAVTAVNITVEGVSIRGTTEQGIHIAAAKFVRISGCYIEGKNNGIAILGLGGEFGGSILDNVISGPINHGITLTGMAGGRIEGNQISNFGSASGSFAGIFLQVNDPSWRAGNNSIRDNTIVGRNAADQSVGIQIANTLPGNLLMGNVVRDVHQHGTLIQGDGNHIVGNVFRDGQNGVQINGNHNIIENNQCEGNSGWGVDAGAVTNHFRNNALLNNSSGPATGGTDDGGNIF